jgi:transcriptional regulator with XRE-family HTH domain
VKLTRLREKRLEQFWSLNDLAKLSGVSKATIVQIEAGRVDPQPRTIRKLAEALGVKPEELL